MDAPGTGKALDTGKDTDIGRGSDTGRDPESREVVVKVWVNSEGKVEVDPDYFSVSKKENQEVRWECVQGHGHSGDGPCFSVEFKNNDSPFYEFQFTSDAPVSGLVRRNVLASDRVYKYTVRIGKEFKDPGGGVRQ
jgi:hypothetical protein